MRIERTELERKEQELDDNLTRTAGLLSIFSGYVAFKDHYYGSKPDMMGFAVLITFSAMTGLYVVLKTALAWESRKA